MSIIMNNNNNSSSSSTTSSTNSNNLTLRSVLRKPNKSARNNTNKRNVTFNEALNLFYVDTTYDYGGGGSGGGGGSVSSGNGPGGNTGPSTGESCSCMWMQGDEPGTIVTCGDEDLGLGFYPHQSSSTGGPGGGHQHTYETIPASGGGGHFDPSGNEYYLQYHHLHHLQQAPSTLSPPEGYKDNSINRFTFPPMGRSEFQAMYHHQHNDLSSAHEVVLDQHHPAHYYGNIILPHGANFNIISHNNPNTNAPPSPPLARRKIFLAIDNHGEPTEMYHDDHQLSHIQQQQQQQQQQSEINNVTDEIKQSSKQSSNNKGLRIVGGILKSTKSKLQWTERNNTSNNEQQQQQQSMSNSNNKSNHKTSIATQSSLDLTSPTSDVEPDVVKCTTTNSGAQLQFYNEPYDSMASNNSKNSSVSAQTQTHYTHTPNPPPPPPRTPSTQLSTSGNLVAQPQYPQKVSTGTAPLRTSEQIRLAVAHADTLSRKNKLKNVENSGTSSLVEKLRWLTSLDDNNEMVGSGGGTEDSSGNPANFATWPIKQQQPIIGSSTANHVSGSGSGGGGSMEMKIINSDNLMHGGGGGPGGQRVWDDGMQAPQDDYGFSHRPSVRANQTLPRQPPQFIQVVQTACNNIPPPPPPAGSGGGTAVPVDGACPRSTPFHVLRQSFEAKSQQLLQTNNPGIYGTVRRVPNTVRSANNFPIEIHPKKVGFGVGGMVVLAATSTGGGMKSNGQPGLPPGHVCGYHMGLGVGVGVHPHVDLMKQLNAAVEQRGEAEGCEKAENSSAPIYSNSINNTPNVNNKSN